MKEVKIKERFENAFEGFFDTEKSSPDTTLSAEAERYFQQKDSSKIFSEKSYAFVTILKQVFLFLPGAFLLFYISMGSTFAFINYLEPSGDVEIGRSGINVLALFLLCLVGSLTGLMTWFGLGDIRNSRHLVIPGSIIASGITLGTIVGLTSGIFSLSAKIMFDFSYAIYLFPIALVVPFLAKGLVDRNGKDSKAFDKAPKFGVA